MHIFNQVSGPVLQLWAQLSDDSCWQIVLNQTRSTCPRQTPPPRPHMIPHHPFFISPRVDLRAHPAIQDKYHICQPLKQESAYLNSINWASPRLPLSHAVHESSASHHSLFVCFLLFVGLTSGVTSLQLELLAEDALMSAYLGIGNLLCSCCICGLWRVDQGLLNITLNSLHSVVFIFVIRSLNERYHYPEVAGQWWDRSWHCFLSSGPAVWTVSSQDTIPTRQALGWPSASTMRLRSEVSSDGPWAETLDFISPVATARRRKMVLNLFNG